MEVENVIEIPSSLNELEKVPSGDDEVETRGEDESSAHSGDEEHIQKASPQKQDTPQGKNENETMTFSNDLLIIQEEQKSYIKKLDKERSRTEDLEAQIDEVTLRLQLIKEKTKNGRLVQENEQINQKLINRLEYQLQTSNSKLSMARNSTLANKATVDRLRREKQLLMQILEDLKNESELMERKTKYCEKEVHGIQEKKKKIDKMAKSVKQRMIAEIQEFSQEMAKVKSSIQQSQTMMLNTIREQIDFAATSSTSMSNTGSMKSPIGSPQKSISFAASTKSPRSHRHLRINESTLNSITFSPISPKSPWKRLFEEEGNEFLQSSLSPSSKRKVKKSPRQTDNNYNYHNPDTFSSSINSPYASFLFPLSPSSTNRNLDGEESRSRSTSASPSAERQYSLPPATTEEIDQLLKDTEFTSLLELLQGVEQSEEMVFRLYSETQSKHEQVEAMEAETKNIELQLHDKLTELHHLESNQYRLKKELEANIDYLQQQIEQYLTSYSQNMTWLTSLQGILTELLENIALRDSARDQHFLSTGITDRNLPDFLGLVEERIDQLIQMSRAADFLPLKAEDFLLPAKATAPVSTNRMHPLTVSPNKSLVVVSETTGNSSSSASSKHQSKEQLPLVTPGNTTTTATTTTSNTSPTNPMTNNTISPVKVIAPTFLPTMQEEDDDDYGESPLGNVNTSNLEDEDGNSNNLKNTNTTALPKKVSQHVQPINIVLLKDIMNRKIQKLSLVPIQMGIQQPTLQQTNTPHNSIMIPNQISYRQSFLQQPNLHSPNSSSNSGNTGNLLPSITSSPSSP